MEEHGFDTEGGAREGVFITEGGGGTAVSIRTVGGSGEAGGRAWERSYLPLSWHNHVASEFYFLETTLEIVEERKRSP